MNKPLELFYYQIQHKLFLLPLVTSPLVNDIINVIKSLLFVVATTRIISPPDQDMFDYHSIKNNSYITYIDTQGVVYNQGLYFVLLSGMDKTSKTWAVNYNDNDIVGFTKDDLHVVINLKKSHMITSYLSTQFDHQHHFQGYVVKYKYGIHPMVYQFAAPK